MCLRMALNEVRGTASLCHAGSGSFVRSFSLEKACTGLTETHKAAWPGGRLSDMLNVLGRLMAPLVAALKATPILVALALRTLEYWIDSLNPEFLEPVCAPVAPAMLLAIWGHLRPHPYPFGPKALQLLGKLGGRNRRFLHAPLELTYKSNPEHGLRLILTFHPATSFLVPLDRCIALARGTLLPRDGAPADAGAGAGSGDRRGHTYFRLLKRHCLACCSPALWSLTCLLVCRQCLFNACWYTYCTGGNGQLMYAFGHLAHRK